MKIESVQTDCYRIPLPHALTAATHGQMTHFQFITARVRDDEGLESPANPDYSRDSTKALQVIAGVGLE